MHRPHLTAAPLPLCPPAPPTGALVGPPWSKRENGFVLREAAPGGASLYYEPHCDFDAASVSAAAPVDVVVTPPASQILLGYPLVGGNGRCFAAGSSTLPVCYSRMTFDEALPETLARCLA